MITVWLLYSVLFLALFRYAMYKARRRRLEELIEKFPGPWSMPVIGNAYLCLGKSKVVFKRAYDLLYHTKSPTRVWVGPIPVVLIYDPKNFQIVSNETLVKSKEYRFLKNFLGEGLITINGEKWKQKRRSLNPAFNINLMNAYFLGIFNEFNAKLVKSLDQVANTGSEIDLWDYVFKCTRDTICVTAMGYRDEEIVDENKGRSDVLQYGLLLEKASTFVTERMMKPWLHPSLLFNLYNYMTGHDKILEEIFKLPLQIIRQKKKEMLESNNNSEMQFSFADVEGDKKSQNFIEILLKSEIFHGLPEKELAEEVVTFILTGSETSAITISFTLLMLARYPECQDRVYKELMSVFDEDCDGPVQFDDLAKLPYLEQCVKETLRRFPPAPMALRQVEKDIILADGKILPAGARALLGIIGVHLSESIYEKPFSWNPERFSPEEIQNRHPCSFVPFSVGPRSCIGAKYAMITIKTQLATILRKFQFSTNMRLRDIRLGFDIVLRNKTGYNVFVNRRSVIKK